MSDNDKWVWSTDEDPIPALFRPEPSTSRKKAVSPRPDTSGDTQDPGASASLGKGVALHLEGKSDAALQELSAAIQGGENLAELHQPWDTSSSSCGGSTTRQELPESGSGRSQAEDRQLQSRRVPGEAGALAGRGDAFQKALDTDPKRLEARLGLESASCIQVHPQSVGRVRAMP